MEINFWAVLICGVIAMILGALWYGPLFGKTWMRVLKVNSDNVKARREMQKKATPLYVVQFILTLFQVYVLAHYIQGWQDASGVENALWIWAAFIMPIIAQGAMWNNDTRNVAWTRFFIQAGYQLVLFVLFGIILGMWR